MTQSQKKVDTFFETRCICVFTVQGHQRFHKSKALPIYDFLSMIVVTKALSRADSELKRRDVEHSYYIHRTLV